MGISCINNALRRAAASQFMVRRLRPQRCDNRAAALIEVEKILVRGGAVQMQDCVGGVYVTELQRV